MRVGDSLFATRKSHRSGIASSLSETGSLQSFVLRPAFEEMKSTEMPFDALARMTGLR